MKIGKILENFYLYAHGDPIPTGGTAFFDSGMGGLNVLFACVRAGLSGNILYYGDNARAPYGEKEKETIRCYAKEAFDEFARLKVGRAVIACNTVSALCLEAFRKIYPFPIYGTAPPVLLGAERGGEVFVFVTKATAQSDSFKCTCADARSRTKARIRVFALDGLAGEVEKNLTSPYGVEYEKFLPNGTPDAVVLGCTHYSYLIKQIRDRYGCPVYDSSWETAKDLFKKGVFDPFGPSRPFPTTFPEFSSEETEKRGESVPEQSGLNGLSSCFQTPENLSVYFLGSGKVVNKPICEQMFALKN